MSAHQENIINRLDALSRVVVNGDPIGEISPTAAARAAKQPKALLLMLLDPGKDPRISTLSRAAETLGVDVSAIVDPDADMSDVKRWPPPSWINSLHETKERFEARRLARIHNAIDQDRPWGVCPDCGNEDALIGNEKLCGACYQRARRARIAISHQD